MLFNHSKQLQSRMQQQQAYTNQSLRRENLAFLNTGGRSQENCCWPAFMDSSTQAIFLSRFANGKLAPLHILDGLPAYCVLRRDQDGHVCEVLPTIVSGFVKDERFYTRAEIAAIL